MSRGAWTRKQSITETRLTLPAPRKIGVLSDTHGLSGRRCEVIRRVADFFRRARVDLILHAGDAGQRAILDDLGLVAMVTAVRGNADPPDLIESLPDRVRIEIGSRSVLLVHGHHGRTALMTAKAACRNIDLVVFGHSHKPWLSKEGGTILFNPGSPTERRWNPHFGIGLIDIEESAIEPELILFEDARQLDAMTP